LVTIVFLTLAGAVFCGCKTTYEPVSHRLPGEWIGEKGNPVKKPVQFKDDSLRSQNYRYSTTLPKPKLDRIMAAMEQYHLRMFDAIKPKWTELPKYVDVVVPEEKVSFREMVGDSDDAVVDSDFVAVIPSKRKIVVLYSEDWKDFSRRLFRAQARVFFHDSMPGLPLWLREGMVSFFEEVAIGGIGGETKFKIVGYNAQKLADVQELMESESLPQLSEVMAVADRENWSDSDRLTAWAFVYWSQHSGKGSQRAFKKYLKAIENGGENANIEDYLGISLQEFEERWKKWLLKQEVYLGKAEREQAGGREK
jgi:hypothetical protein